MSVIRDGIGGVLRWIVRKLLRIYYPRIEITDQEKVPPAGPVLLVSNHPNSMLDPVVLGTTAQRPVRFMAKAPLFDIPIFGQAMYALGMIPAYRGSDDPTQVGRNVDSLVAGADVLAEGAVMGIFPEGKTHDEPALEMVRSGPSRIAMQAVERGVGGVKIVPVGLHYEDKERLRSSIWVRVGDPIDANAWLQQHEGDVRKATRLLTQEITRRLKELVLHLDDPKLAPLLDDLETLVPPPPERAALPAAALRQRKAVADSINYFLAADRPRAEAVARAIDEHREKIHDAGLTMRSSILHKRGLRLAARLVWRSVWLVLLSIPSLFASLFHLVPFTLTRFITEKVKTPGRSAVSFGRLILGLPIYGAWYALFYWYLKEHAFTPVAIATILILLPFAGLLALSHGRNLRRAGFSWMHQIAMLFGRQRLEKLRAERGALQARLSDLAAEYRRAFPLKQPPVQPPRVRLGFAGVSVAVLVALVLGWAYLRTRAATIAEQLGEGPDLAKIETPVLAEQLDCDEAGLTQIVDGLKDLETKALLLRESFAGGERSYYSVADDNAVRQALWSYLSYRKALLRLVWYYQNFAQARDERLRLRAQLLETAAAAALYEYSVRFVTEFDRSEETIKKLNEGEPRWGIPPDAYDTIRKNLARADNHRTIEAFFKQYHQAESDFERLGLKDDEPYARMHAAIAKAQDSIAELGRSVWTEELALTARETKALGYEAYYAGQSLVATWIGDTMVRKPREGRTLIGEAQVNALKKKLQPGDILLERRNWFLSNMFLPGYWPHAAMYVGTAEDIERLGLKDDPIVAKHWAQFAAADAEGHHHVIIEALSEGIVCASLEHSIGGGDSTAVLRPKLSEEKIKQAIVRAFSHLGKPYDFEFDFFSNDKIVCTELVYRCYQEEVDFPLVDVMGRQTLPAIEIVRKFANDRKAGTPQLDLIAFLDGDEKTGACRFLGEEEFVQTLERPALTFLQSSQGGRDDPGEGQ